MSPLTFMAGVRRSLIDLEDDRVLRRAVVEQLRRAVPFDAFAWLLTDPETTVGAAPLADVPCLDRLSRLAALRYTSGRRWTEEPPGVPHRPVQSSHLPPRRPAGAGVADGAAVLLLGPELTVRHQTPQAESDLRALLPTEESRRPIPAAAYNVAAQLLAAEAGIDSHRLLARTMIAPGHWISVQAARLGEDIAVTLGPVEQRERWILFCRAHGLTGRETQIVICLAEGDDTRTGGPAPPLRTHHSRSLEGSVRQDGGEQSTRASCQSSRGLTRRGPSNSLG
ncbi:MAG TPA: hypothetical protein VIT65_24700 [Microlunatus sp.]